MGKRVRNLRETKQGNKGMTFEGLIKYASGCYKHSGQAILEKQNTLCTPLRNNAGKIVSAKYEEKATVDFMGQCQGIPIAFEAKHCGKDVIQLSRVVDHQSRWLTEWTAQQGIGFVLVSFQLTDVYLIPWENWVEAVTANAKKKGQNPPEKAITAPSHWQPTGKASIRKDELPEGWRVTKGGGVGLDYLSKVQEICCERFSQRKKAHR